MTWNFERLMSLATGYWPAAALNTAVALGLFEALAARPRAAADLAADLTLDAGPLADLLDALTGMELLVKTDGVYALAPEPARFFHPSSPACMLGALRYNIDLYPVWGRLTDTVRTGQPAVPPHNHLGDDPERTRRFVLGMDSRAAGLAPALLPALAGLSGTLLDLACGGGTFSRLLAQQQPALRVTQFDLPGVLAVARELAESSPALPRLSFVAGDYRSDPLPGVFDTVLYSGALHQETPESARSLARAIRGATRPGGTALVFDLMTEADGTRPLFARLFSLNMRLTSSGGRVFTTDETAALLREAGFSAVSSRFLPGIPYALVTAR